MISFLGVPNLLIPDAESALLASIGQERSEKPSGAAALARKPCGLRIRRSGVQLPPGALEFSRFSAGLGGERLGTLGASDQSVSKTCPETLVQGPLRNGVTGRIREQGCRPPEAPLRLQGREDACAGAGSRDAGAAASALHGLRARDDDNASRKVVTLLERPQHVLVVLDDDFISGFR